MKTTFFTLIVLLNSICAYAQNGEYKFKCVEDSVTVYSDISSKFSKTHAHHANLTWKYFSKIFKYSPGSQIVIFYTEDPEKQNSELKNPHSYVMKGARQVDAHWTGSYREWYIVPCKNPDYGTQQHEIGHDFLYFTYIKSEDNPWFKEGTGMYFEAGIFDQNGDLVVSAPYKDYYDSFISWNNKKKSIPLSKLLYMSRDEFYTSDYTKTYAQAMMLVYYLMKEHKKTMDEVFKLLNSRTITNNNELLKYIIDNTDGTLDKLETNYINYAKRL